jgi:hypothetical protein
VGQGDVNGMDTKGKATLNIRQVKTGWNTEILDYWLIKEIINSNMEHREKCREVGESPSAEQ